MRSGVYVRLEATGGGPVGCGDDGSVGTGLSESEEGDVRLRWSADFAA